MPQAAGAIKHSQRCALFSPRPCARAATQTWEEVPGGSALRPTQPWPDAAGPGLRRAERFRPARRNHVWRRGPLGTSPVHVCLWAHVNS